LSEAFTALLSAIQLTPISRFPTAERAKILPLLRAAFAGGRRCYVLSRDERDRELFHEWGFVLFVFREFLFVGPERNAVERYVIGYD
jgi:hypothetical protein